jgi:threonyl-tRNA synthetase
VNFIRELYNKYEYEEVITPQLFDNELWRKSGHWEHFSEYMYNFELGERDLSLKPMNCPGHTLIYSSDLRSYRDLPLRFADFGRLHRYEKAGVLSGLTRVRSFSQDDAHIFCTPEQIGSEISHLLEMVHEVYEVFDFGDSKITLSTRPEKAMGDEKLWDNAETILKETLENSGADFDIDEGEGAFYGPKIDFNVKDALGRLHQLATIQLDFTLPERFDLTYVDEDGKEKRPVMIHRAILGSLERFFGVYLEHCAGEFPLWLAPVQAAVLSVSEKAEDYAEKVGRKLKNAGIRYEVDIRADKIGAKIRKSEVSKINVMFIVGEKESEAGTVSLRRRFLGDLGNIKLADIISVLKDEITNKRRLKKSQK